MELEVKIKRKMHVFQKDIDNNDVLAKRNSRYTLQGLKEMAVTKELEVNTVRQNRAAKMLRREQRKVTSC